MSTDPMSCRCDCHEPGMNVSHVAPCCFAAGMTVKTKTEWRCEECLATFDSEEAAWKHWMMTGGAAGSPQSAASVES